MLTGNQPIINPMRGKNSPDPGSSALLVSTQNDLEHLSRLSGINRKKNHNLYTSRLYSGTAPGYSATGPYMGAPYAVMLLETLVACGAKKIIVVGWCGALSNELQVGDILVASGAFSDEGTSRHYHKTFRDKAVTPSQSLTAAVTSALECEGLVYRTGQVWTTDAIYRETPDKITAYRDMGALAVEMELSALFTVAAHRGVEIAAILTVSDDLSSLSWKPGFKSARFKQNRKRAAEAALKICMEQSDDQ